MSKHPRTPLATWSLYLINRGDPPLRYFANMSEKEAKDYMAFAAEKAFDGSDADGFILIRDDYPVPSVWPGGVNA